MWRGRVGGAVLIVVLAAVVEVLAVVLARAATRVLPALAVAASRRRGGVVGAVLIVVLAAVVIVLAVVLAGAATRVLPALAVAASRRRLVWWRRRWGRLVAVGLIVRAAVAVLDALRHAPAVGCIPSAQPVARSGGPIAAVLLIVIAASSPLLAVPSAVAGRESVAAVVFARVLVHCGRRRRRRRGDVVVGLAVVRVIGAAVAQRLAVPSAPAIRGVPSALSIARSLRLWLRNRDRLAVLVVIVAAVLRDASAGEGRPQTKGLESTMQLFNNTAGLPPFPSDSTGQPLTQ